MMFIVAVLFAVAFKVVLEALDSLSDMPGSVLIATLRVIGKHKGLDLIKRKSPAHAECLNS